MKAVPKFSGKWYDLNLREGEAFDVPEHLQAKVSAQPGHFTVSKPKRKKADAEDAA